MPYRGTTPTLLLQLKGLSSLNTKQIWVTLKGTNTQLTFDKDAMTIEEDTATIKLSQSDTLAFSAGNIEVQARILCTDGTAYATNKQTFYLSEILKQGAILA